MSFNIPCPHCDTIVEVPNDYLGGSVRCPRCDMVFAVQRTGVMAEAPPDPLYDPTSDLSDRIRIKDVKLPRSSRYEPGRGGQLLTLGLASLGISVLGMLAGSFVCGAPVLFGPPAFVLGLIAWVRGQADMEKLRLAILDPYAEKLTRLGWVSGIVGAAVGVLLTLTGLCGSYLMLVDMVTTANSLGAVY